MTEVETGRNVREKPLKKYLAVNRRLQQMVQNYAQYKYNNRIFDYSRVPETHLMWTERVSSYKNVKFYEFVEGLYKTHFRLLCTY